MVILLTYWGAKLRFVDGLAVQCILLPEFVYAPGDQSSSKRANLFLFLREYPRDVVFFYWYIRCCVCQHRLWHGDHALWRL